MSCGVSKELLALHAEGDLSEARAEMTARHVTACEDCRRFLDALRATQALLKSHRRETIRPADCAPMRRAVMSIIEDRYEGFEWALRIERALVLGFGLRSCACATVGLLAILSVLVAAQMRQVPPTMTVSAAVFQSGNTLVRPEGYRGWIRLAPSAAGATHTTTRRVYIDPVGYREYEKTARFPEGTVIIWESPRGGPDLTSHPHHESTLLASVKDSVRFDGGWGFFDFTGRDGTVSANAQAMPESSRCGGCHRQEAETDHVFTQFYPVLQSARRTVPGGVQRDRARLTALLAVPHPSALSGVTC